MNHVDRSHLAEVPPPDDDWNPTDDDAPDAPPAAQKRETIPLRPLHDLIAPALDRAERRRTGEERPIPVPFPEYADALGGGFWPGMHVLVSGTGAGKSQLALMTGLSAARNGYPVGYVGLELDECQIALRAISEASSLSWSKLYLGKCSASDIAKAREVSAALAGLPFYAEFGSPMGWPAARLVDLARRMRAEHPSGPMLIVLDYLQLIGDDPAEGGRRRELRERIGSAAYAARHVANTYDVAIVVISSAARTHYGLLASDAKEAGLVSKRLPGFHGPTKTIRNPEVLVGVGKESGELEYAADTVTALIRWPAQLDNGATAVICAVPKVRAGFPRWSALAFERGRFSEYRVQDIDELPEVKSVKGGRPKVADPELTERLIVTIRGGRYTSKRKIVEATEGEDRKLYASLNSLLADGSVTQDDQKVYVVSAAGAA